MMVGNGLKTKFWDDLWIGDKRLRDKFLRLFSISLQKQSMIAECGFWDWVEWIWSFQWRKEFFGAREVNFS